MCVIIHRKPDQELPFDKLKSACIVNPDGFGLVIPDRGKLEQRRVFVKGGNDPDQLAKIMEDAKGLNVYAHLRYRTKGPTDLTNVHPFTVATRKKHGVDVQFMHNGTLTDFGTPEACDSKVFAREIITPLFELVLSKVGPERALYDPLFGKLLAKYAGGSSVFTLVDNFGNNLIVNKKQGYDFAWGWASNQYSFDRGHREPTNTYNTYYSQPWGQRSSSQITTPATGSKEKEKGFNDEVPFGKESGSTSTMKAGNLPSVAGGTEDTPAIIVAKGKLPNTNPRQNFCDVAEINDLSETINLTQENIEEMVEEFPQHAALLIMDLIAELYARTKMKEAA